MNNVLTTAVIIATVTLVTWFCRIIPFIVFSGSRGIPESVNFIGKALPAAIMVVLVLYCLRNTNFTAPLYGLAEIISLLVVIGVQLWRKNTITSVLCGTACYMILIRTVFAV